MFLSFADTIYSSTQPTESPQWLRPSKRHFRSCSLAIIICLISLGISIWSLIAVSFSFDANDVSAIQSAAFFSSLPNSTAEALRKMAQPGRKGRQDSVLWLSGASSSSSSSPLSHQDVFLSVPSSCALRSSALSGSVGTSNRRISFPSNNDAAAAVVLSALANSSSSHTVVFKANRTDPIRISKSNFSSSSSSCDALSTAWANGSLFCDTTTYSSPSSDCFDVPAPSYSGAAVALLLVRAVNGDSFFADCDFSTERDLHSSSSSSSAAPQLEILAVDRKLMVRLPRRINQGFFHWRDGDDDSSVFFSALVPASGIVDTSVVGEWYQLPADVRAAVTMWYEKRRRSLCDESGSSSAQNHLWSALLVTKTVVLEANDTSSTSFSLANTHNQTEQPTIISVENVSARVSLLESGTGQNAARAALHFISFIVSLAVVIWLFWLFYIGDGDPWQAAQCSSPSAVSPLPKPTILSAHLVTIPLALVQLFLVSDPSWFFTWAEGADGIEKRRDGGGGSLVGGAVAARWADLLFRCLAVPALATIRFWMGDGLSHNDEEDEQHEEDNTQQEDAQELKSDDHHQQQQEHQQQPSPSRRRIHHHHSGGESSSSLPSFLPSRNINRNAKPLECDSLLGAVCSPFFSIEFRAAFSPLALISVAVFLHAFEAVSATFRVSCHHFSTPASACSDEDASLVSLSASAPDPIGYTVTSPVSPLYTGYDSGSALASQFTGFPLLSIFLLLVQLLPLLGLISGLLCQCDVNRNKNNSNSGGIFHNPERRRWLSLSWGLKTLLLPLLVVDAVFLFFTSLAGPPAFVQGGRLYLAADAQHSTLLTDQSNSSAFCVYSLWRLLLLVFVIHPMPEFLRSFFVSSSSSCDHGWRQPHFGSMLHRAKVLLGESGGKMMQPDDKVMRLSQVVPSRILTVVGSAEESDDGDGRVSPTAPPAAADTSSIIKVERVEKSGGDDGDDEEEDQPPAKKDVDDTQQQQQQQQQNQPQNEQESFGFHQLLALPRPAMLLSKLSVVQQPFLPSGSAVDDAIDSTFKTARAAVKSRNNDDNNNNTSNSGGNASVLGQAKHIVSIRIEEGSTSSPGAHEGNPLKAAAAAGTSNNNNNSSEEAAAETLSWFAIPRAIGRSKRDRSREERTVVEQLMLVRHRWRAGATTAITTATVAAVAVAAADESAENHLQEESDPPSAAPAAAFLDEKDNQDDDDTQQLKHPHFETLRVDALQLSGSSNSNNIVVVSSVNAAVQTGCAAVQDLCRSEKQKLMVAGDDSEKQNHSLFFVDLVRLGNDASSTSSPSMTAIAADTLSTFCSGGTSSSSSECLQQLHSGNISNCTVIDSSYAAAEDGLQKIKSLKPPASASSQATLPHFFVVKLARCDDVFADRGGPEFDFAPTSVVGAVAEAVPVLVTEVPCIVEGDETIIAAPSKFVLELLARNCE